MITQENIPYTADEIKAMVKTCEKYNKALERADTLMKKEGKKLNVIPICKYIFPEFDTVSKDERIRKVIYGWIYTQPSEFFDNGFSKEEMLAWVEKQGEKKHFSDFKAKDLYVFKAKDWYVSKVDGKIHNMTYNPTDKVEPKFKVGDWVLNNVCLPIQIASIKDDMYVFTKGDAMSVLFIDGNYHLWTIQDAMDGDVLATENFIFIFKNIDDGNGVHYYCQYEISRHENDNQFDIALPQSLMGRVGNSISHYSPATKEQRDLLFQKMKEAGYEWDSDKKELKKVEPKRLDADKVIAWLVANICDFEYYVKLFKKDFGL